MIFNSKLARQGNLSVAVQLDGDELSTRDFVRDGGERSRRGGRLLRDRWFGKIDGHEALNRVNDFVLDFFDQRLKQQPTDFPSAALAMAAKGGRKKMATAGHTTLSADGSR